MALACANRCASISIPYRNALLDSRSVAKAAPSPTQGSSVENCSGKLSHFLSRAASDGGRGKKPSLACPWKRILDLLHRLFSALIGAHGRGVGVPREVVLRRLGYWL